MHTTLSSQLSVNNSAILSPCHSIDEVSSETALQLQQVDVEIATAQQQYNQQLIYLLTLQALTNDPTLTDDATSLLLSQRLSVAELDTVINTHINKTTTTAEAVADQSQFNHLLGLSSVSLLSQLPPLTTQQQQALSSHIQQHLQLQLTQLTHFYLDACCPDEIRTSSTAATSSSSLLTLIQQHIQLTQQTTQKLSQQQSINRQLLNELTNEVQHTIQLYTDIVSDVLPRQSENDAIHQSWLQSKLHCLIGKVEATSSDYQYFTYTSIPHTVDVLNEIHTILTQEQQSIELQCEQLKRKLTLYEQQSDEYKQCVVEWQQLEKLIQDKEWSIKQLK